VSNQDRRSEWTVIVGIGLVVLGIWFLLTQFAGWAVAPIAIVLALMAKVGWPLLLIALGVLLVIRARGGGWAPSGRQLYRSRSDRVIAGVLGGIATWLGVNPTPLRVIYAFVTLFTGVGAGLLAYLLAAVLLPEEPAGYTAPAPRGYTPPAPYAPAPPAPPVPPAPDAGYPGSAPTPPAAPPAPPAPPA